MPLSRNVRPTSSARSPIAPCPTRSLWPTRAKPAGRLRQADSGQQHRAAGRSPDRPDGRRTRLQFARRVQEQCGRARPRRESAQPSVLIDKSYRASGLHHAREVNRAHVLSALDRNLPEAQIMAVLGIGRTAIWRTRAAYLEGGVEHALHDLPSPANLDGTTRTSKPGFAPWPARNRRPVPSDGRLNCWSRPRVQAGIGPISRETVRRLLKKTVSML